MSNKSKNEAAVTVTLKPGSDQVASLSLTPVKAEGKLFKVQCGGLFRFSTYKPESKQYGILPGHYVYGSGGAWLDLLPNASYVKGGDASYVIVTEAKANAIKAYGQSKGYTIPQMEEVKAS